MILDFDAFSLSLGVSSFAPMDAGLHRTPGGLSGPARRAASRRLLSSLEEWNRRRRLLAELYAELADRGLVRSPTRLESLELAAAGTGESAAAARRLLEKQRSIMV